jgi:proteasome lid subunit RPN8/RPN11
MEIALSVEYLRLIEGHGEASFPNEGAGFLFGLIDGETVEIRKARPVVNKREAEAQYNRYELSPLDFANAEMEADQLGVSVVGVFHSHPDHPARPSEFDRDHALPNFVYLITSVMGGKAEVTYAWRLRTDRAGFNEDTIKVVEGDKPHP